MNDSLISRQALCEYALNQKNKSVTPNDIMRFPSAQLEIISCKDCKHLQKWRSKESAMKFGQIYECARNVFDCPKPEDFCSHAERKE
jgi:hypothetical protein